MRQVIRKSQWLVEGVSNLQEHVKQTAIEEESELNRRFSNMEDDEQEGCNLDNNVIEESKQATVASPKLNNGAIPLSVPESEASPESAQFLYNVS